MASTASIPFAASPMILTCGWRSNNLRKRKRAACSSSARNARICIALLPNRNFQGGTAAAALNIDEGEAGGGTVHGLQTLPDILEADARAVPGTRRLRLIPFLKQSDPVIFYAEQNGFPSALRLHQDSAFADFWRDPVLDCIFDQRLQN